MAKLDEYLRLCVSKGASDLHFSSQSPLFARIDGDLVPVSHQPLSHDEIMEVMFEVMSDKEKARFKEHKNLDRSYRVEGTGNFRGNIFMSKRGVSAVFRTIPDLIPTMEDLGLPDTLKKVVQAGKGLVLVTGPTGSGKSTTLASMINHLNLEEKLHILTVEDPVEFVHQNKQSLISQREIGSHVDSFADALKYALREDPDVILVGEMRDLETIALAMTAAETGHLVFGTLHTRGAASSVDRIIDSFPANQQAMIRTMLSESLVAVISQALLKKVGGGRVGAFEIMLANHAISNLIREGKTFQIPSQMQTGRREGMIQMDQYILNLVDAGLVAPDEAEGHMEDTSQLNSRKLQWIQSGGAPKAAAAQIAKTTDPTKAKEQPGIIPGPGAKKNPQNLEERTTQVSLGTKATPPPPMAAPVAKATPASSARPAPPPGPKMPPAPPSKAAPASSAKPATPPGPKMPPAPPPKAAPASSAKPATPPGPKMPPAPPSKAAPASSAKPATPPGPKMPPAAPGAVTAAPISKVPTPPNPNATKTPAPSNGPKMPPPAPTAAKSPVAAKAPGPSRTPPPPTSSMEAMGAEGDEKTVIGAPDSDDSAVNLLHTETGIDLSELAPQDATLDEETGISEISDFEFEAIDDTNTNFDSLEDLEIPETKKKTG